MQQVPEGESYSITCNSILALAAIDHVVERHEELIRKRCCSSRPASFRRMRTCINQQLQAYNLIPIVF